MIRTVTDFTEDIISPSEYVIVFRQGITSMDARMDADHHMIVICEIDRDVNGLMGVCGCIVSKLAVLIGSPGQDAMIGCQYDHIVHPGRDVHQCLTWCKTQVAGDIHRQIASHQGSVAKLSMIIVSHDEQTIM